MLINFKVSISEVFKSRILISLVLLTLLIIFKPSQLGFLVRLLAVREVHGESSSLFLLLSILEVNPLNLLLKKTFLQSFLLLMLLVDLLVFVLPGNFNIFPVQLVFNLDLLQAF